MYDFGSFSLSGSVNQRNGNATNGDDTEYAFGVTVPVGAWVFSGGYAHSKTKDSAGGAKNGKANGFALGATPRLSKRTRVYAGWRDVKVKNNLGVFSSGCQKTAPDSGSPAPTVSGVSRCDPLPAGLPP